MHYDLWTPNGPAKPISPNIKAIDRREMLVIRSMHTIAQKHDIVLACARCRRPFQGLNAPQDATESIECGCRELRAAKPAEPIPAKVESSPFDA